MPNFPEWPLIKAFRGRGRSRLIRHYFFISVLLVAGGLIASGLLEVYFRYHESRNQLALLQKETAAVAALRIERFTQDVETAMKAAAKARSIARKEISQEYGFELKRLLFLAPAIMEAVALDVNGMKRAQISRLRAISTDLNRDFSSAESFRQAVQGKAYFGPVYFVQGSEPYMTFALPIEHFAGEIIGVLQAEVNLKYVWEVISGIKVGQAGYAYTVSRSGHLIAHPDISLVLQQREVAHLDQVKEAFKTDTTVSRAKALVAYSVHGAKVISSYAAIPRLDWTVFIERPIEEAYEPLYASMMRTSSLLLIGFAMALLSSLFLARRVVGPVETLRRGVERIGSGDLGFRLNVKTGDEIEILAEEFNKMTAALQEAYQSLEHKVAKRTQELAVANTRLKELDRLKSDFVSNVSHELRTPLTAIKGAVDLLLRGMAGPIGEKPTHYLARVRSNTQHLTGLITDLLDLSKIEAGKTDFAVSRVSLEGLAHEVVETLRPIAAEKRIALQATAAQPSIIVSADRDKLTQVLMNLIGNAIKFTPARGAVSVSIAEDGKGWAQVSIQDSGPGIRPEETEKIFEKFYQVTDAGGKKPKGTGLGLAISKALVELHGGRLWVEPRSEGGSIFSFALPISEARSLTQMERRGAQ